MKRIRTVSVIVFLALFIFSEGVQSAEKEKKPYTQYWMSVVTQNQTIPGMSSDEMSGMGGLMGKMMGGPSAGPRRELLLQLNSPQQLPPEPLATHDIPPGQNMGKTLPLLIPEQEKVKPERYEDTERPPMEKPKMRMLIYWGCSEEIKKGQPRVIDTEKMSPAEFGKAFAGRGPSPQYPPRPRKGWIYADWPNKKSRVEVPRESSLQGEHLVHGNYMPDVKFSIDQRHDFMAPVEFTSVKGGLSESIRVQWREIPTAIGYFAQAMAHNEKTGETIFWFSSELPDIGFGLLDYLSSSDVRRFIKEKIVMDPKTTSCTIPRGIFKDTGGGALQFIGYGEDLFAEYPPKPKDPKSPWNLIWSARVRLKSTGMTMLGEAGEQRPSRVKERPKTKDEEVKDEEPKPQESEKKQEEGPNPLKKLKGIFGF